MRLIVFIETKNNGIWYENFVFKERFIMFLSLKIYLNL